MLLIFFHFFSTSLVSLVPKFSKSKNRELRMRDKAPEDTEKNKVKDAGHLFHIEGLTKKDTIASFLLENKIPTNHPDCITNIYKHPLLGTAIVDLLKTKWNQFKASQIYVKQVFKHEIGTVLTRVHEHNEVKYQHLVSTLETSHVMIVLKPREAPTNQEFLVIFSLII
jgi:hypothetical protein